MALGGGTFVTQNKILPGSYINFVSAARASANVSDRGYAAIPMALDWGPEGEVITVTSEEFIKNSMKYFGHSYTADEIKNLREVFCNASTLYTYRLNGGGDKAANDFGTAKYSGALGNTIATVIELLSSEPKSGGYDWNYSTGENTLGVTAEGGEATAADTVTYDGVTYATALKIGDSAASVTFATEADGYLTLVTSSTNTSPTVTIDGMAVSVSASGGVTVELSAGSHTITKGTTNTFLYYLDVAYETVNTYAVSTYVGGVVVDEQEVTAANDLLDNDYVVFNKSAALAETAGTYMTGGTDGETTALAHQEALNALSGYSFNVLGCASDDPLIKKLYAQFTESQRDDYGVKFQTVIYNYSADYEGVISVPNTVKDDGTEGFELIYWLTGAEAGCAVNASLMNTAYDGEYMADVSYSQTELENLIKKGYLVFHNVKGEVRVLKDINTFVSTTTDKNSDFCSNQVIRVLDQIGNDIAVIFNDSYLGKVPNDAAGRISFWGSIIKYIKTLENIRAVEDFEEADCEVTKGDEKGDVVVGLSVMPTCAMEKLYMTVYVN